MNGGTLTVYFKGDSANLDKETSKLDSRMSGIGKSIGTAIAKGAAVAGAAMVGLVGKSVQMAGELEQQIGGTEAVFKKYATQVQNMSKTAYETAGISANDYMATMNKMGALMQGSGISIKKSMDLSSQAMQRAADVASIMGIDINMAMESIAGAAKGNFTMMDNLGVAMNATTIEAYALEKGLNKSWNEMSKAEQIGMAMEMFLERSAYATGNYAKENETFAGSLQTMKSAFANFMSGAGDIDAVIESTLKFADILVKNITKMAPKIVNGIIQLINNLIPQIPVLLQRLLPTVITGILSLVQGIINAMPQIIAMLATMLPTLLTTILNGAAEIANMLAKMLPDLMPQIVDAILSLLPIIIDNLPLFIETGITMLIALLTGIISSVPTLLSYIPVLIGKILKLFMKLPFVILKVGVEAILNLAKAFVNNTVKVINGVKNLVKKVINTFKNFLKPGALKEIGKNLVEGLWNGINNAKDWVLSKIKGFGSAVLDGIKSIFGVHSPSTEFAWIGKMNVLGLEEGMEKMQPELQRSINGMFNLSPSMTGSMNNLLSPNINVNNNISMETDPLGQIVSKIKTFGGGAKNDFNYGMGG